MASSDGKLYQCSPSICAAAQPLNDPCVALQELLGMCFQRIDLRAQRDLSAPHLGEEFAGPEMKSWAWPPKFCRTLGGSAEPFFNKLFTMQNVLQNLPAEFFAEPLGAPARLFRPCEFFSQHRCNNNRSNAHRILRALDNCLHTGTRALEIGF